MCTYTNREQEEWRERKLIPLFTLMYNIASYTHFFLQVVTCITEHKATFSSKLSLKERSHVILGNWGCDSPIFQLLYFKPHIFRNNTFFWDFNTAMSASEAVRWEDEDEREPREKFNTNQVITSRRHHNCKCCGPLYCKKSLWNNAEISHAVESKYIIMGQRKKSF